MTTYVIQQSSIVDQITEDGQELTQRPYPFYVDNKGNVDRQDFWRGSPRYVIGFAQRLDVHEINLWWREIGEHTPCAAGMYLVTADNAGNWDTHSVAVESVIAID